MHVCVTVFVPLFASDKFKGTRRQRQVYAHTLTSIVEVRLAYDVCVVAVRPLFRSNHLNASDASCKHDFIILTRFHANNVEAIKKTS